MDTSQYLNKWVEQPVSYNQRDLLVYALGIGCTELNWVYEQNKNFAAFPTYPIVLLFKGVEQGVLPFPSKMMTEGPRMPPIPGVKVGLDGERFIEKVNDIDPKGGEYIMRTRFIGVHKKGSGASAEMESQLVDKSGKVYYKITSGSFLVGAKDFKDSGESRSQKCKPPARAPDAVEEIVATKDMAKLYRLSGDYNPLHIDPEFAKMAGFGEPILHGLCSLGITCRAVMRRYLNNDASQFKAINVRFASPVLPGQTIVVEMWKEGSRIVTQSKVKETGKVVISNCFVDMVPKAGL